ncbi:MAG: hypothetical protein DMF11_12885 [Verrucomicrobia bacterium]|nr:MAG: hypothetical protein DMF11_12885 [Verrucomicrobiota bacterium]
MKVDNFFAELKRRNVYKVAVAYAVVAWLVIQVSSTVLPTFHAPEWVVQTLVMLVALGFPIALVIAWAFEATPEGIKRTEVADAMPAAARQKKHAWIYIVVIGGGISVALFFVGRYSAMRTAAPRPASAELRRGEQSEAAAVAPKSIAVLPFDNLSRDPDNAYFCEGVQDEILTRLAKVADLKVISRTSTQHFKSAPDNLPQIAKQLGVAHILEGSVQKASDQVRVNVQLINAVTDAHLWADTYDRKLTDIFAVESEIAKTIAETLQARLSGSEKQMMAAAPTTDTIAYELYLKGRFFWNKRTGADLKRAIDYFKQAIAKDPNYALAYAGLADSYTLLSVFSAASPHDSIPQARAAAKKALELDNTLAEAHASFGRILSGYDYDFERAIAEFERAIQLNPNYATSYHWISNGPLTARGEFDRAIAEGKRAVELDPLSMIDNADLGQVYFYAHRYDEAISQVGKALEIDPHSYLAHFYLGQIYQIQGHLTEAIAEYQKAVELDDDPQALAFLGQAQARIGQHDKAQKILSRMTEEAKSRYVSAYSFALMFIALGDKERAIDALERAYREGAANDIITIKVDPMLEDLRGHPRFEALAEKIVPAREFKAGTASK